MRLWIGIALMVIPFATMFSFLVYAFGWKLVAGAFGAAIIFTASAWVGAYLIWGAKGEKE